MAEILVQNIRNPNQVAALMLTIRRMVMAEAETGHTMWILEASTREVDINGDPINPVKKWLSDQTTLSEDVNDIINELCRAINWEYYPDTEPPQVAGHWPLPDATDVSPDTDISITLTEEIPSSGIDLNSLQIKVKGFDLTDQVIIKGDIHSSTIKITPGTKYMSAINEDFHNGSEYSPD
jgi:hypothetical protein